MSSCQLRVPQVLRRAEVDELHAAGSSTRHNIFSLQIPVDDIISMEKAEAAHDLT